jgi:hypothetical protein
MWSVAFWKATAERAIKTFAQTLAVLLVVDPLAGFLDIDWWQSTQVAGLATAVSVLTSVASSALTSTPGPSLTSAEVLSPPARPQE